MQPIIPGPSAIPLSSLTLTGSPPDLRAWQVGQLLQAQVLTGTVNNQVTLRIGQTTLAAQTQTPLTAGQTLTVQVARLGDQPVLKLLPQTPPVLTDPLTAALRSALPRQTGLAPLLANLGLLAQSARAGNTPPPLPATVLQAAEQIYRDLSDSHQAATARGLQRAIRDTGLFLESKLAQLTRGGSAELGTDFKAALLRLQTLLNETPRPTTPPTTPASSLPGQGTATPPRAQVTENAAAPQRGTPEQSPANGSPRSTTSPATAASPSSGQSAATQPREQVIANSTAPLRGLPVQPPSNEMPPATPANTSPASPPPGQSTTAPPAEPATTQPPPPLRGQPVQAQAASTPSLARLALADSALHELRQQTEGSLARLQLNQLASVPDASEPHPSWLLELPLRHQDQVDLFHLRIGREAAGSADADVADRPWVVNLAFDLPGLGPVQARVAIQGEQVSTTFWAEQAGTTQAFHSQLETLRQNLQQAGLGVGDLLCRTGQAPRPPAGPRAPLMDTRA